MKGCLQFTCSIKRHLPFSSLGFWRVTPLFSAVSTVAMVTPATELGCRSCQGAALRSPGAGRFGSRLPLVTPRFHLALIKSTREASGSFTGTWARVIWLLENKGSSWGVRGRKYILLIQFITARNGSASKSGDVGGRISPSGAR